MSTHRFAHLESIYRNYDIRGKYPDEISEAEVEKIGAAIVKKYKTKTIAVGRDIRPSADALFTALVRGITTQGCNVLDLGLVTTPMTYFVCGRPDVDATVMITASHMPAEFNGLKISIEDAKPVSSDALQEIKAMVEKNDIAPADWSGSIISCGPRDEWRRSFKNHFNFSARPFKIVIDPANMIGALEIETFKCFRNEIEVIAINDNFNPTDPAHEANPVKLETLKQLSTAVVEHQADIGIAFDGDADRVGFVDETGQPVPSDIIGALLAKRLLDEIPHGHVIIDPRSTKSVEKIVKESGGTSERYKVGHSNIRMKMREQEAILGIELAGHFFFRDSNYSEGGPLPAFLIMDLMMRQQLPLSKLVEGVREYHHSGEINSEITRSPEDIYESLKTTFSDGRFKTIDGLSIEFDDWWCNIRPSANDPVMRLNLEANTVKLMEQKRDEVLAIIRS